MKIFKFEELTIEDMEKIALNSPSIDAEVDEDRKEVRFYGCGL